MFHEKSFGKRKAIGFYRKKDKTHPITGGTKGREKTVIIVTRPLLGHGFRLLASSAPFAGQVCATYQLAKSLYDMYDILQEASNAYDSDGWTGVIKVIGKEMVYEQLASVQTNIIWNVISEKIEPQWHNIAKKILVEIVDKLTVEEIEFVDRNLT